ncbi:hypothetical protein HQ584_05415 [Patescibacteria group bacterium]|nr:hypothetical protein [Patescibacteria group bacterium]
MKVASHSGIYLKNWQVLSGIGGRFSLESVATLPRNGWQVCSRIYRNTLVQLANARWTPLSSPPARGGASSGNFGDRKGDRENE